MIDIGNNGINMMQLMESLPQKVVETFKERILQKLFIMMESSQYGQKGFCKFRIVSGELPIVKLTIPKLSEGRTIIRIQS